MKCLYLCQELAPYFAEGGLGLAARTLPGVLDAEHDLVHDLVLPYYPWLVDHHALGTEHVMRLPAITVAGVTATASVERLACRTTAGGVYLIRADRWYDRAGIYRDGHYAEFEDAVPRAAFFGRCVAEWLALSGRNYDLVHGNDWQSGAAMAQLRSVRGAGAAPALLMNVHSAEYIGRISPGDVGRLALPEEWQQVVRRHGEQASLLLLGLLAADAATTGSPTYARELLSATEGSSLGESLAALPLTGIVAGVDAQVWNPAAKGRASRPYTPETVTAGKRENKELLQRRLGLKLNPDVPLFGVCTRLVEQKGVDLLLEAVNPLVRDGAAQLVIVGQGNERFQTALAELSLAVPRGVQHIPYFEQELAWLVYAGSDFTVMPSRVEPCGVNQLIAMSYGTVPLVSSVGGLHDTVTDLLTDPEHGTGFVFPALAAAAVRRTLETAAEWLRGPADRTEAVRRRLMAADWSWSRTGRDTAALYHRVVNGA